MTQTDKTKNRIEPPSLFNPLQPRYSERPFPSYRFIQGITPHPLLHPQGHSYGKKPRPSTYSPPQMWSKNETYLYGVDLYNFNYWWEAHEAWESIWQTTQKTDDHGRFLQGLIQIAAAMIKWWTKNQTGMKRLFQEGRLKLNSLSENRFMGINLKVFLKDLERFESDPKEGNYPFIELS